MKSSKKEFVTDEQLRECCPDLPPGPLDTYRRKCTFDWRRMKLVYDDINCIQIKKKIWSFMETHPFFQHSLKSLSLDEERHITVKRMYALYNENFVTVEDLVQYPELHEAESEAIFMFDSSTLIKLSLTFRMFINTIRGSGREHHYHYIEAAEKAEIGGCFALTEISHGSNAKKMRTTATYCPNTKQFVLHSPDFEAAKCWVGSLGQCATHGVVYAMLISKGQNHGLHAFVVPIRDPKTLKPYPGVIVGDLGEKIGLNGIDNGFVMFNNYRLPKEAALDKLGGVNDAGDYQTPFKDPNKRFGASLGVLSGGRVHITCLSTNYLQKAIVIAIRYSALRKQFGPEDSSEELPVLEYQQQQIRLLPYLAATYAMRIFCNWFLLKYVQTLFNNMMGVPDEDAGIRGMEIHALSSAAKPLFGWTARDGIQNCREACGGHGYLKASGIGDLRNENDANCTYEGENSLLLQQTSNWLLTLWPRRKEATYTPYGSLQFLKDADISLTEKCKIFTVEDMMEPRNLIHAYKWLTLYSLKMTYDKVATLKGEGKDNFQAKNESQSYNAVTLSTVYAENFILNHFYQTAVDFEDAACSKVLLKMVSLYGAFMLERHLATLYIGGFFTNNQGLLLREAVLHKCRELVPEAVSLVDTLAPPDWCLKSVLGMADGEVYKHIQNTVMTYPGSMSRPGWWKDVVFWESYIPNKL